MDQHDHPQAHRPNPVRSLIVDIAAGRNKNGVVKSARVGLCLSVLILCVCPSPADVILGPPRDDPGEYRIGVADVLRVRVWDGREEKERVVSVRPDGKINFDLVGAIHVRDFTPTQVADVLKLKLKSFYQNPDVTVLIDEYVSRKALVIGDVREPGPVALMGEDRVLDVLARAGWARERGAPDVHLIRGNSREKISLPAILSGAATHQNHVIQRGDVLYVPAHEARTRQVRVQGAVRKPGTYGIHENMTMLDAVMEAGGPADNAHPAAAYTLRASGYKIQANLKEILDGARLPSAAPALEDGDVVFVPERSSIRVYVLGMVRWPGEVRVPEGAQILAAVAKAGYHSPGAVLNSTRLVRMTEGGRTQVFDVPLKDLVFNQLDSVNIALQDGDVIYIPKSVISNMAEFWETIWPLVRVQVESPAGPPPPEPR